MNNFCNLLNCDPEITVSRCFKRASLKHHPDKGGDEDFFKKILNYYDSIPDKTKKCPRKSRAKKSSAKKSSAKKSKSLKPCKSHQYRDPVTNRCRNKSKSAKKSSAKKSKSLKPCKSHQYRDPVTNRCRNKSKSAKKSSAKKSKSLKPCKSHQYRDPVTNRCRNKSKSAKKSNLERRNCIDRSSLPLKDVQIKIAKYMDTNNGLLVALGTGFGKTLSAVLASQCFLDKFPNSKIVFIGPSSLVSNFKKEIIKYGGYNMKNYEMYSFDTFYNSYKKGKGISLNGKFLIIDEAHNLRNPSSKKTQVIVKQSFKAKKRILLTATPFVNSSMDLVPIANIVLGEDVVKKSEASFDIISKYLNGKLIFIKDELKTFFPKKIEHYETVYMSDSYYDKYATRIENEKAFGENAKQFHGCYRKAVNSIGLDQYLSGKMTKVISTTRKGKTIVYTNWLEYGVNVIEKTLKKENISFRAFTGKIGKTEKKEIVDSFNNDEFDVLIITKSGAEGLDLKGVRNVIILDPPWNKASLDQIIGRAIRYKSHEHLPPDQRKVDVYYMILDIPVSEKTQPFNVPSGDVILYEIIKEKEKILSLVNEELSLYSI